MRKNWYLVVILVMSMAIFVLPNAAEAASGSNITNVVKCVQVGKDIKVTKGSSTFILTSTCRDAGYGLRQYTLTCVNATQYKTSWVTPCNGLPDLIVKDIIVDPLSYYDAFYFNNPAGTKFNAAGKVIIKNIGNSPAIASPVDANNGGFVVSVNVEGKSAPVVGAISKKGQNTLAAGQEMEIAFSGVPGLFPDYFPMMVAKVDWYQGKSLISETNENNNEMFKNLSEIPCKSNNDCGMGGGVGCEGNNWVSYSQNGICNSNHACSQTKTVTACAYGCNPDIGCKSKPVVLPVFKDGDLVKVSGQPIVWVYANNKLHEFKNVNVYKDYYSDYSNIKSLSSEVFGKMVVGDPVCYRAGSLVNFSQDVSKIYYSSQDCTLHQVTTDWIIKWFGSNYQSKIVSGDYLQSYYLKYNKIGSVYDSNSLPEGAAVKDKNGDTWYIQNGLKRIVSQAGLLKNSFQKFLTVDLLNLTTSTLLLENNETNLPVQGLF